MFGKGGLGCLRVWIGLEVLEGQGCSGGVSGFGGFGVFRGLGCFRV